MHPHLASNARQALNCLWLHLGTCVDRWWTRCINIKTAVPDYSRVCSSERIWDFVYLKASTCVNTSVDNLRPGVCCRNPATYVWRPNNTGWVRIYTAKEGEARSSHLRDSSGVFSLDEPTKNFTPWGGSLPDQQCSMRFNLNLNKGNNIYKDASTVQSPALQSLACIRIWYRPKLAKILVAVCFRCKR